MFARMKNSWTLMKCSLDVMMRNRRLLLFPVVTTLLTIVIGLMFLAPVALQPTGYKYTEAAHWETLASSLGSVSHSEGVLHQGRDRGRVVLTGKGWAYFAVFYLLAMFCAVYFNVAFYHEIVSALKGGDVSIARGLRFAASKIKPIIFWSLFAGLVGLVIRTLEEKVGFVGKIVVGIIGIAWSVSSIFVVPAIISQEEANPLKLLKSSAVTVKRTWGETLVGFLGMQSVLLAGILGTFVAMAALVYLSITLSLTWLALVAAVGSLLVMVGAAYLVGVAGHIYKCALYLFAFENFVPAPYTQEMMFMAWKHKKAKQGK